VADIFPFFQDSGVKIELGNKGEALLTTPIRDRNGNLVAEITRNHWRIYPLYSSDKNYTDDALEVKDSAGHVVLQVKILPKTKTIQLQGEWWNTQGSGIRLLRPAVVQPGTGSETVYMNRQNQHLEALIKSMFQYPSKEHWREFAAN